MKKIIAVLLTITMITGIMTGCGADNKGAEPSNLEGSCEEILAQVYENAELDSELRDAMQYYQTTPLDESNVEYIIGTTEVKYTDSVYSAPMMSSIAYQCVVLRIDETQDVEDAKQLLTDNADPRKWVCVEPESVQVVNVGDVILYIMADQATADAVTSAFTALGDK